MWKNEFKTPKFVLTAFFAITTTLSYFFTEKMTTDQYMYSMGVILALYGTVKTIQAIRGRTTDKSKSL